MDASQALLYAVDVLLAYRALCLYRMSRKMVIFNLVFFILCILSTAVIIAIAFKTGLKAIPTPEYLTGCWSLLGGLISLMAVPGLIFELWLFGMVVFKVVQFSHELGRGSRYNLVRILLMDSMSWFVMCVAICLIFGRSPNSYDRVASMIIVNGVAYGVLPIGLRIIALPYVTNAMIHFESLIFKIPQNFTKRLHYLRLSLDPAHASSSSRRRDHRVSRAGTRPRLWILLEGNSSTTSSQLGNNTTLAQSGPGHGAPTNDSFPATP